MSQPELAWTREPLQDRSRRTLEAILDAAEALLERGAWADTPVAAITREAGSSVGAFYGRFSGKEDLLRALYARYVADSTALLATALRPGAWEGVPLADVVAAFSAFVVDDYRRRRGLRRAFLEGTLTDPEIGAMVATLTTATIDALHGLLRARAAELGPRDPRAAADFCHRIAFGVLDQDLVLGHVQPISDADLKRELAAAILGYLSTPAGGAR